jgi:AcrR family transcriptional regulator
MKTTDEPGPGPLSPTAARRPGRPRSDQAEEAIIDAVFSLFSDGASYDALSMEMIAAAAKVGKATIYRRWPNKEGLILDAICRRLDPKKKIGVPGVSVREDLVYLLELMREHLQHQSSGPAFNVLNQVGISNPTLYRRYHEVVIEPRRDAYREVLRRGIATGELREDLDVERAMLMLTAPMLTATRHHPPPVPVGPDFSEGLADDLLRGAARTPAQPEPQPQGKACPAAARTAAAAGAEAARAAAGAQR